MYLKATTLLATSLVASEVQDLCRKHVRATQWVSAYTAKGQTEQLPLEIADRGYALCVPAQPQCWASGRGRLLAAVGSARESAARAGGGDASLIACGCTPQLVPSAGERPLGEGVTGSSPSRGGPLTAWGGEVGKGSAGSARRKE
ncbi:hypothetical protein P7K49_024264 [Saguinus oedipus]|uniref:Secreted protein n=1 Tax=Saguinus oedipus TaxID=9490 RepID=A0ABQ9UQN1_SAGOE|nr:hypothetical protein P7K49_024264 [Saguinus oedipus]